MLPLQIIREAIRATFRVDKYTLNATVQLLAKKAQDAADLNSAAIAGAIVAHWRHNATDYDRRTATVQIAGGARQQFRDEINGQLYAKLETLRIK